MKFKPGWVLLAVAAAGLAIWAAARWLGADEYDYAAAFEQGEAAGVEAAVIDVAAVAGRSPEEVRALLGEPQRCESELYSTRCRYPTGQTEVVYIGNKADWITIGALHSALLAPETLARLGLPPREPDEQTEQRLVWRNLAGLKEVQLVGADEGVSYARIKAVTP